MAYGDNRNEVTSDSFPTSIDGDWTNPQTNDYSALSYNSGNVEAGGTGTAHQMAETANALNDDQYCRVTVAAWNNSDSQIGAVCRAQSGTDGSAYLGAANDASVNGWIVAEADATGTYSALATTTTGYADPTAGDILTLEAEGTTLRMGEDSGGDTERVNTTDATLSGGDAGVHVTRTANPSQSVQVSDWSAGNIGAAAAASGGISLLLLGVGG